MNKAELTNLTIEAAKEVCKRGYDPDDACRIVRLSAEAFAVLVAWYREWAGADACYFRKAVSHAA